METLVVIKPDAIEKNLIGKIISIFELEGFSIVDMAMLNLSRKDAEDFYITHKGKDFFERNIDFIVSGPIVAMVLRCDETDIITRVREIIGSTVDADPWTIRGKFGVWNERTLVHASDSSKAFDWEIDVLTRRERGE